MELFETIRQSKRLAKWDIRPIDVALFICFALTSTYVIGGSLVQAYAYLSGEVYSDQSLPFIIASGFGLQLGSIFAWLLFRMVVSYENRNQAETLWRSIKIGALGFFASYLALIPVTLIWRIVLDLCGFEHEMQLPVLLIQEGGSLTEMILMGILIVFGAPIGEELVYRGFLYRYLNRRIPFSYAIFATSALFALMHQNLFSFVPLFVLGAGLCIVYRVSGNLVSSMVMHGLFNLVNFAMIFFTSNLEV